MGRKKIQISRIMDERNRQVRPEVNQTEEIYSFSRSHLQNESLV